MTAVALLDRILPATAPREVHRVAVEAAPAHASDCVRQVDVLALGVAGRLVAPLRDRVVVLDEDWREVVRGVVDASGGAIVAWSLRVDPREDGGSWITFDARAGARFERAARLLRPLSRHLRARLIRRLVHELGAVPDLDDRALPGDHVCPHARFQATREIVVEAPPSALWPWVQRQGGGGVVELEPARSLVLGDPAHRRSHAFVLEPIGDEATHLVVRVRGARPHLAIAQRHLERLKQHAEARDLQSPAACTSTRPPDPTC